MLGSAIRFSLSGVLFRCWVAGAAMALAADKPNVVVILADDMGSRAERMTLKQAEMPANWRFCRCFPAHGNPR